MFPYLNPEIPWRFKRPSRLIFLAMLLTSLASCTALTPTLPTNVGCTLAGASTGALVLGGSTMAAVSLLDCGPVCVQTKIAYGESIHESVTHHVHHTQDLEFYAVIPAAVVGAAVGGYVANRYCSDEPLLPPWPAAPTP